MDSQHENRFNYFGKAFFAFLFLMLVYASSVNVNNPESCNSPYKFASELKSNSAAVMVEAEQFHFQNSLIPSIIDYSNFKSFNHNVFKIISENKTIFKRIIFLQREVFFKKPFILRKLFAYYHFMDIDDLPVLG